MIAALEIPGCPTVLAPVCAPMAGAGSTVLGAGADAVLSAMGGWVVAGASWLLGQVGKVMSATTRVDVTTAWFTHHYRVMAGVAMVVAVPMLLVATIQAVYRQSPAVLLRSALVHLPLAFLLTGVAVQLVQLALVTTDALCATVAAGARTGIDQTLSGLSRALLSQAGGGPGSAPLFVVLLGALLVAAGAIVLWLELLVRAAAVYVAVVFLPLGLASLIWPAVGHWCRRLVDTLAALVLSKFVIVAVLSLAASAVGSGTASGFSAVLAGGALLLLAAFAPFALLRLVPVVEAGAVHQLEGARHRVRQGAGPLPESAAGFVLRAAREGRQPGLDPGMAGTDPVSLMAASGSWPAGASASLGDGRSTGPGSGAGTSGATARETAGGPAAAGSPGTMIPDLAGQPTSDQAFWDLLRSPHPPRTPMHGTGGILPGSTGLPLWGTPSSPAPDAEPGADGGADGSSHDPYRAPLAAGTGVLLGHDELGPLVHPVPGAATPGTAGGEGLADAETTRDNGGHDG